VQGPPGASRALEFDIPAMAASIAIVLAAWAAGVLTRKAARRWEGRWGRWRGLIRRLPLLTGVGAGVLVLGASLLPLRERVVRSATGTWPVAREPAFATSLTFVQARSLAGQRGGGAAIAAAVLAALPADTPADAALGAGYAEPGGAVLDDDISVWGRPGWLTVCRQRRRIAAEAADGSEAAGLAFAPGPMELRRARPFTLTWISGGGGVERRVVKLDVGKVLLKVVMVLGVWMLARLPFVGFEAWRRRRRSRRGLCLGCGYDRRGLGEGAVCPECGRADRAGDQAL
jgi:hypothetical protein